MNELPRGLGFYQHEYDSVAIARKREERKQQQVATTALRNRKSTRGRAGNARTLHMRFALWASQLDHKPMAGETCDHFGICYESARRLVHDWKTLNQED